MRVTDNKLEGNEGGDVSGNVHDTKAAVAAAAAGGKTGGAAALPEDVVAMLVREDAPLLGKAKVRVCWMQGEVGVGEEAAARRGQGVWGIIVQLYYAGQRGWSVGGLWRGSAGGIKYNRAWVRARR